LEIGENMKELYISMLKTDDEIQEYFIVKSVAIKVGANNKQYLDLLLGDSTGEVPSKKWDISDGELSSIKAIKDGDIVKVKATVTAWNGQKQMKVMKIRVINDQDEIEITDFINAAPEDPKEMYDYIYKKAFGLKDKDLNTLCTKLLEENKEKLMYYPAAQKNHHAQKSGLLYHIKRMLMSGEFLCQVYTNLNVELVITGVIIHDIEKLNELESNELGISSGYSFEGQMLGHLVQGVKLLDRIAIEIGMPREKAIMLEHMMLTHHYEPEFGSPKKPLFPEAEILHYLDMIDARMFDMQAALDATNPGEFSDRVWTLDNRKLYKMSEQE
jgi:3'-5' exoribonuclease